MPNIIKKRCNRSEASNSRVKGVGRKNTSNAQKKLKSTLKSYSTVGLPKNASNNLASTDSSDSLIYVGSYTLSEKYPLIDLTNSLTNMKTEERVIPLQRYPNLINCHTVYTSLTSLVRNQTLTSTVSTSRLLDSIEGTKLNSKTYSKSTSCLIVVNDHKHVDKFKTIDIREEAHLLSSKEKSYIDQVTRLTKEDHDIINHSLEIAEDINVMETCSPETITNSDVSIEKLMQMYEVKPGEEFH